MKARAPHRIKHCQKRPTIEAKETYYLFTWLLNESALTFHVDAPASYASAGASYPQRHFGENCDSRHAAALGPKYGSWLNQSPP